MDSTPIITVASVAEAFDGLTFREDRTPATTDTGFFTTVAPYRDGAIFAAHYAGNSAWERHDTADEIVMVLSGETDLIVVLNDEEHHHHLSAQQLVIVPKGVWHRFETPSEVKVLSVTPQPTDHMVDRPF